MSFEGEFIMVKGTTEGGKMQSRTKPKMLQETTILYETAKAVTASTSSNFQGYLGE